MKVRGPWVILGFAGLAGLLATFYFTSVRRTMPMRILMDESLQQEIVATVGDRVVTRYDMVLLKQLEAVRQDRRVVEDDLILLTLLEYVVKEEILARTGGTIEYRELTSAADRMAAAYPDRKKWDRMKDRLQPYTGTFDRFVVRPALIDSRLQVWHSAQQGGARFEEWYRGECGKTVPRVSDPKIRQIMKTQRSGHPVADAVQT